MADKNISGLTIDLSPARTKLKKWDKGSDSRDSGHMPPISTEGILSPVDVLNDDCILEQVIPPSGMSQVEIQENTDNVIIDSEGLEK
jgi:hypothetical protein